MFNQRTAGFCNGCCDMRLWMWDDEVRFAARSCVGGRAEQLPNLGLGQWICKRIASHWSRRALLEPSLDDGSTVIDMWQVKATISKGNCQYQPACAFHNPTGELTYQTQYCPCWTSTSCLVPSCSGPCAAFFRSSSSVLT
jgi:hypothetical protein